MSEVMQWHNYDPQTGVGDPSTPLTAERLNLWSADLVAVSEAAEGYAAEAQEAAETATAPTESAVATMMSNASSQPRVVLDATYAPIGSSGTEVVISGPGIDPTGVTDSTAAIQAKFNSLPASGGRIAFPAGRFKVTSLTLSKRAVVTGAGGTWDWSSQTAATTIVSTSTTATAVTVTAHGCKFQDIAIANTSGTAPTAGVGLLLSAASGARLQDITVSGFYDNIEFGTDAGVYWQLNGVDVIDPVRYGLYMHNTAPTHDWADPVIMGCTFTNYTTRTPVAAIHWESGGGLRFTANKINSGPGPEPNGGIRGQFAHGLDMVIGPGVLTMDLMATGNSFENCTTDLLRITQADGTGQFGAIAISGNEFYNSAKAIVLSGTTPGYIHTAAIDGNAFLVVTQPIQLVGIRGAIIGDANQFTNCGGPLIQVGTGCESCQFAAPNTPSDDIDLITNASAGVLNSDAPMGRTDHVYTRAIPAGVNSTSTYKTMYYFDLPTYTSGTLELTFTGSYQGVDVAFARRHRWFYRQAGAVVMATIGTDVGTGGTTAMDISIDTATTPGRVYVKTKLPASSASTGYHGELTMRIEGPITRVHKGA